MLCKHTTMVWIHVITVDYHPSNVHVCVYVYECQSHLGKKVSPKEGSLHCHLIFNFVHDDNNDSTQNSSVVFGCGHTIACEYYLEAITSKCTVKNFRNEMEGTNEWIEKIATKRMRNINECVTALYRYD